MNWSTPRHNMYFCVIFIIAILAAAQAATIDIQDGDDDEFGYDEEAFDDSEFEYFYNMELLEKLELLANNETVIDEHILLQLAEDDLEYEDTTELDIILDKLLEEGNLIEEVLDEIEDEISGTKIHEDDSFMDLFDQIMFYGFLVSFVVMFIISSICTGIHYFKKVPRKAQSESEEDQKEIEFVFFTGKEKPSRKHEKGVNVGIV